MASRPATSIGPAMVSPIERCTSGRSPESSSAGLGVATFTLQRLAPKSAMSVDQAERAANGLHRPSCVHGVNGDRCYSGPLVPIYRTKAFKLVDLARSTEGYVGIARFEGDNA